MRRRHVIRVGGFYAVAAWLLVQVAATLEGALNLPEWFDTMVTSGLLIGFPIALLLAWAFEVTPEGVRSTRPGGEDVGEAGRRGRIADAVLLVLFLGVASIIGWDLLREPAAAPDSGALVRRNTGEQDLTIAVMPFVNMSDDPANAFFADGVAEEILNALTRVHGLRVIARTSSFALRGTDMTIPEIGQRLDCDLVLEGSVRKAGNRIRVTAQLIDTVEGLHLWSEVFDRGIDDFFGVQDEVSSAVATVLPALVGIEPLVAPAPSKEVDSVAYRLYLEARYEEGQLLADWQEGRREMALARVPRIEDFIERALELAPQYGPLWVLKGDMVRRGFGLSSASRDEDDLKRWKAADVYYQKALELDPRNAEVLRNQATLLSRYLWQWDEAERLYRQALEADASSEDLHTDYAYHLSKIGRCVEGLKHTRIGIRLDPNNDWRRLSEPRLLICLNQSEEAKRITEQIAQTSGSNRFILQDLINLNLLTRDAEGFQRLRGYIQAGDWPEHEVIYMRRDFWLDMVDAHIAALEGDTSKIIELTNRAVANHDLRVAEGREVDKRQDLLWTWSMNYAWYGEYDKAIGLLVRAIDAEVIYLPQMFPYGYYEFPEPMRSDPRYVAAWNSRPELIELKRLRLEALEEGQFYGILPDGTVVESALQEKQ